MVLKNILPIGHKGAASFWGTEGVAFAEGYISLPITLILFFGLPYPVFFGTLINQKDRFPSREKEIVERGKKLFVAQDSFYP